jgi:hypothetical protein
VESYIASGSGRGDPPRIAFVIFEVAGVEESGLETVQDEPQSELELVSMRISGLQDVLDRHLGEMGKCIRHHGFLVQDVFGRCSDVTGVVQWQGGFLQCEAVDVAVKQGYRVRGHRQGETRGVGMRSRCRGVSGSPFRV